VALALAGLDAGTAFGGMGASRAMTIGALAEPALLVAVLALSLQAGTSNLPGIVTATLAHPGWVATPQRLLALAALVVVVFAETGRIPVDNPSTHLELTMIHEAMVLEYAGPELALVTLGGMMRLGLLLSLLANLFFPWGIAATASIPVLILGLAVLAAKTAAIAAAIAVTEVSAAKLRLFRVPEILSAAFVLSVLAVVTGLVLP
jgi:formate hydrogenlyase subunit 4